MTDSIVLKAKKKRIWEIDFLRGFALFFMIIDHFLYNFYVYPDFWKWDLTKNKLISGITKFATYYWTDLRQIEVLKIELHYYFVIAFIMISGISTVFSKSSLKRSLQVLLGAYIISIVTNVFATFIGERFEIPFGILHTIGYSMLIYSLIDIFVKNKYVSLVIGLAVIAFYYLIPYLGVGELKDLTLSMFDKKFYLSLLGFGDLPSADFFGMVPWFGFFFIGVFLGKTVYKKRVSVIPSIDGKWNKLFIFLGQNSIWVYLLHQVVLLLLFVIIGLLAGYSIPLL
jgi:uncharacterized membrane protein